jgi:hypothetical protein
MTSCDAIVPPSSYRGEHRCEKRHNLVRVGRVKICKHHAAVLEKHGRVELGAGVALERKGTRS